MLLYFSSALSGEPCVAGEGYSRGDRLQCYHNFDSLFWTRIVDLIYLIAILKTQYVPKVVLFSIPEKLCFGACVMYILWREVTSNTLLFFILLFLLFSWGWVFVVVFVVVFCCCFLLLFLRKRHYFINTSNTID
jgi:hypothetical protein